MSLSSHLHQLFKLNHDPSSHIFKGSIQKGDVPRVEGGLHFFKGSKSGCQKKSCKPK